MTKEEHDLIGKIIDEIAWTFSVHPRKFQNKEWYLGSLKYGVWEKKNAEIIAQVLRNGFVLSLLQDAFKNIQEYENNHIDNKRKQKGRVYNKII